MHTGCGYGDQKGAPYGRILFQLLEPPLRAGNALASDFQSHLLRGVLSERMALR